MPLKEYNDGCRVIESALRERIELHKIPGASVQRHSNGSGPQPADFILSVNGKTYRRTFTVQEIEACATHLYGSAATKVRELIEATRESN